MATKKKTAAPPTKARKAGAIELPERMHDLVAALWDGRRATTIPLATVKAVEKELGCAIPDLVLALLLAQGQTLDETLRCTAAIKDYYRIEKSKVLFREIAFTGFGESGSEPRFACFRPGADRDDPSLYLWDLRHPELPRGEELSISEYLEALEVTPTDSARTFAPEIVKDTKAAVIRVSHPKFGEGTVVEDTSDGKWTIDFGSQGTKRLASSFVTRLA